MNVTRDSALAQASVPTLLVCLAHITGDDRWLGDEYLPKRDVELFADESGGLSERIQQQVRLAASKLLDDLAEGRVEVPAPPDDLRLLELMSFAVGERVGPEYAPMFGEEMGLRNRDVSWSAGHAPGAADRFEVVVVGAGISGICAAIKLDKLGIPFTLIEKSADLGGTWFDNDYPECGVDTPNHFYSYSFQPNTRWSRYFSKRNEILRYLGAVDERHAVRPHTLFETTVESLTWHEGSATWQVALRNRDGARTITANAVISAVGQLNVPKLDAIRGAARFDGPVFHSADWDYEVSLAGKSVGVIGTGASAMQLLRTVADQARSVTIFQRSPQWVKASKDYHRKVTPEMVWLLEHVPCYAMWYRFGLFWRFGDGLLRSLRRDAGWAHPDRSMNERNDRHRQQMTDYLTTELDGRPDLIEKTLPHYPPYGKRILVDNDWFATLRRENVRLVTEAVDEITANGLVTTDGHAHEFDVLILATGFDAARMLNSMAVHGRSGRVLSEVWGEDDPRAYLGITIPGFPNLFCMYGPNTNLAHGGSVIFQAECQMRYISSALREMIENAVAVVDVRPEVHDEYNSRVDTEHRELVWAHPGVHSWYRNSKGRVFSPMPWRMVDYWQLTHDFRLTDYETIARDDIASHRANGPTGHRLHNDLSDARSI